MPFPEPPPPWIRQRFTRVPEPAQTIPPVDLQREIRLSAPLRVTVPVRTAPFRSRLQSWSRGLLTLSGPG